MNNIPIIDMSPIYTNSYSLKLALASKINEVATTFGIFYIKGLEIDIENLYEYSKQFHAMPLEYKELYIIGQNNRHAGYVPLTEKGLYADEIFRRRYESFDFSLDTKK